MFTLLKIFLEFLLALGIFYGGMKFDQKFPNFVVSVTNILAWIKKILPSSTTPPAAPPAA